MAYRHSYHKRYMGIKQHVNQLIQAQSKHKETVVHVISILNITRYAAQVKRQKWMLYKDQMKI